jgi:hypothetical protein
LNNHDRVVKMLKELAEGYHHYSKVVPYLDKREPIKIAFETFTIDYYPDLWAVTKRLKKIDVYEVWNTESEDQAIADIYLSAKIPNLLNICIVCVKTRSDSWTKEHAKNIIVTVLKDLEAGNPSLKSVRVGHVFIAEVGRNELKDDKKLRESLTRQFEF